MEIGPCLFLDFVCQEEDGNWIIGDKCAVRDVMKTMRALLNVDGSSCCAQPVVKCSCFPLLPVCGNTGAFVYLDAGVPPSTSSCVCLFHFSFNCP